MLYTPWGYTYASIRHIADENVNYVRCYQYVMPFQQQRAGFVGMGPRKTEGVHGHVWVPIDDTHTFVFNFLYARDGRALDPDDVYKMEHNAGRAAEDYISGTYFLNRNRANDWLIDREVQKKVNYSGIMGVNTQDMALQETMGGIYDRTKEHLGSADSAIIAARRLLMKAIKDVQAGLPPAGSRGEGDTIRPVEETIPVNIPWAEHFKQGLVSAL